MKKGILQKLKEGPVLGDGGYLLELEKRGWVRAGPFTPEVALTNPEALRQLHIEFREAGSEVLQALTFYASRDKLATVGLQDRLEDLNRAAVRIAKEVAGERCLVAGNLSLTWMYDPDSNAAKDRVRATFDEQLEVQVAEEPDFTSLPQFPFELDPLQLSRREMAAYAQRARDIGVDYIGACCGSVAIHIREMARVLGKLPAEQRPWKLNYQKPMSAYEYYDHDPEKVGAVNRE